MAWNLTDGDPFYRRGKLVEKLNEAGFPITKATLETMACRGGGPPFRKFGRYPLYRFSEALAWANARMGESRSSTSDAA